MEKKWQLLPAIEEEDMKKHPAIDRVVLQLLYNRDIKESGEMEKFLNPDYEEQSNDPFLFKHMAEACELIIKHIKAGDKILVFGDYDADGVTAAAILVEVLNLFKAKTGVYIPYRVTEGYGLNKQAMDTIAKECNKLIITVDTGIRNKEEIRYVKSLGVEVILTDHHVPPEDKNDWPDCLLINPQIKEDGYPFRAMAGAGVALKLAQALISKSSLSEADKKKLEYQILDLAAIGTVADMVPLVGENRAITKKGLALINEKIKRIGLKELVEVARLNKTQKIDSWNIGFQLAPRLNAAGRMDHANTAFEILITKDKKEAAGLASELNQRNIERQEITEEIASAVEGQIMDKEAPILIGLCPDGAKAWNEGVVGLVAGRICEKYYRPTLIITKTDDGYKGSGRSIAEINILEIIDEAKEYMSKYGGHALACGFSLLNKDKDGFIKEVNEAAKEKIKDKTLKPKIIIEAELKLEEIDKKLIENLKQFEPFGKDNYRPKFMTEKAVIKDKMTMGLDGRHVKFRFNGFWALAFNMSEEWKEFKIGEIVDIAYYVEVNDFNGREEIQLKLVDIKKAGAKRC